MGQIIDFKTRQPINHKPTAKLEIVGWDDAIVRGMVEVEGRVLVDGIVPVALAMQFKAMCEKHNAVA
jgi:hypothetical protein